MVGSGATAKAGVATSPEQEEQTSDANNRLDSIPEVGKVLAALDSSPSLEAYILSNGTVSMTTSSLKPWRRQSTRLYASVAVRSSKCCPLPLRVSSRLHTLVAGSHGRAGLASLVGPSRKAVPISVAITGLTEQSIQPAFSKVLDLASIRVNTYTKTPKFLAESRLGGSYTCAGAFHHLMWWSQLSRLSEMLEKTGTINTCSCHLQHHCNEPPCAGRYETESPLAPVRQSRTC